MTEASWPDIERRLRVLAESSDVLKLQLRDVHEEQRALWQQARNLGMKCREIAVPSGVTAGNVNAQTEVPRGRQEDQD